MYERCDSHGRARWASCWGRSLRSSPRTGWAPGARRGTPRTTRRWRGRFASDDFLVDASRCWQSVAAGGGDDAPLLPLESNAQSVIISAITALLKDVDTSASHPVLSSPPPLGTTLYLLGLRTFLMQVRLIRGHLVAHGGAAGGLGVDGAKEALLGLSFAVKLIVFGVVPHVSIVSDHLPFLKKGWNVSAGFKDTDVSCMHENRERPRIPHISYVECAKRSPSVPSTCCQTCQWPSSHNRLHHVAATHFCKVKVHMFGSVSQHSWRATSSQMLLLRGEGGESGLEGSEKSFVQKFLPLWHKISGAHTRAGSSSCASSVATCLS